MREMSGCRPQARLRRCLLLLNLGVVLLVVLASVPAGGRVGLSASAPAAPDDRAAHDVRFAAGPPAAGTFNVTVVPHGLPNAFLWGVAIGKGTPTFAHGTVNITEALANGTYEFVFGVTGVNSYTPSPPQLNVSVEGSPQTIGEQFQLLFTLNLTETGLPVANQSRWHAFMNYIERSAAAGQTIQYLEPNGSYQVTVGSTLPFVPLPVTTTIFVNGPPPATFLFSFSPRPAPYNVTFTPMGLPSNASWSVAVDGRGGGEVGTGSSYQFRESNGTHVYSVSGPSGWIATPSAATFVVNGANLTIPVLFVRPTNYAVTFVPSGIGPARWSLTVGALNEPSAATGGSISMALPNGSYAYSVTPLAGLLPFPANGTFWVAGGPAEIPIAFYATSSVVTFTELGLPAGTWWVLVNGTNHTTPAGSNLVLQLPLSSYPYTVGAPNASFVASVGRGNLVVGSQSQVVTVTFLSIPAPPAAATGSTSLTAELKSHLPEVAAAGAVALVAVILLGWRRYRAPKRPEPTDARPEAGES